MTLSRDESDHSDHMDTRMLTALVQLRGALQAARLPLDVPGVEERRTSFHKQS